MVSSSTGSSSPLIAAALKGNLTRVKAILGAVSPMLVPVVVNARDDQTGSFALYAAATGGHLHIVEYLTQHAQAQVRRVHAVTQETALHKAAATHKTKIVQHLLQHVSPPTATLVNAVDVHGQTPLMVASQQGHEGIVQLLVQQGQADVHLLDNEGYTALHHACLQGHAAVAQYLIRHANVSVEEASPITHLTPLMAASRAGNLPVVKFLLQDAGANPTATDAAGKTALAHAKAASKLFVVQYLSKKLNGGPSTPTPTQKKKAKAQQPAWMQSKGATRHFRKTATMAAAEEAKLLALSKSRAITEDMHPLARLEQLEKRAGVVPPTLPPPPPLQTSSQQRQQQQPLLVLLKSWGISWPLCCEEGVNPNVGPSVEDRLEDRLDALEYEVWGTSHQGYSTEGRLSQLEDRLMWNDSGEEKKDY